VAASLFPSVLGAVFTALDPCLKRIHGGESLRLREPWRSSEGYPPLPELYVPSLPCHRR
jgi:hypothetical protein